MRWALKGATTDSIEAFIVRSHCRGRPLSSRSKKRGTTSALSAW